MYEFGAVAECCLNLGQNKLIKENEFGGVVFLVSHILDSLNSGGVFKSSVQRVLFQRKSWMSKQV